MLTHGAQNIPGIKAMQMHKLTGGKRPEKKFCKKTTIKANQVRQIRIADFSKMVKKILFEKLKPTDEFLDA